VKIKKAPSAYVAIIGVVTLCVAGSFLLYTIYSALRKSQISPQQKLDILPLVGQLNSKVIDDLKSRRRFEKSELENIPRASPSITVTAIPSSPSAQPTP